jgi:MFS family permease
MGKLSDRLGSEKVFTVAALLALIPIFIISNLGRVPLFLALAITTMFFITSNGRMVPAMTLVTSSVPPRRRGSFMSLNSSFQQLTAGFAAYLAGHIVSKNISGEIVHYNRVGYVAMCASLGCILIALRIKPFSPSKTMEPASQDRVADSIHT